MWRPGAAVTWQQFVIDGGAHIPGRSWSLGGGSWYLWTHGSCVLDSWSCVATYCLLGISLWHCLLWWDVHGLPQLFVETSVLGGLSSLSPKYRQFHRHTAQGIPDTGFYRQRHTVCDQVSCLWGGPGWSEITWPRRINLIRLMKWPWWSHKLATLQHIWLPKGIFLINYHVDRVE